ncbi:MAG TPA: ABC transporter ATP-binding protein [Gemmatimonadales bacterium]|nr:ABC transporter ATP-binding protein [Gemmatimonadales bacterium]
MTTHAISVEGLEKSYGRLAVLRGADAVVEPGRITALVGPNGAGKTTLLKILLGLVRPDRGEVTVLGHRINGGHDYRARIGYMPQAARFPENLRGREVLAMLRALRSSRGGEDTGLIDIMELEPELEKPVRTLSGGNRQKLNAAIAFLFRPELLILDEPTAGLDPIASGILKTRVRAAQAAGTSVLIASHVMSELEELASDVVFLLDGTVRFAGGIEALKTLTGEARLEAAVARVMRERRA